jgi:undecaprenyl pyrophosphate phosphatase UppP
MWFTVTALPTRIGFISLLVWPERIGFIATFLCSVVIISIPMGFISETKYAVFAYWGIFGKPLKI